MPSTLQRLALTVLCAVACAAQGGCVTYGMWNSANQTDMTEAGLRGFLVRPDGRPESAVVAYSIESGLRGTRSDHLYAVVRFDADGVPAAPFGYRGAATTPETIVAGLGDAQRAAIASPPDWIGRREANALMRSPAFRPRVWERGGADTRPTEQRLPVRFRSVSDRKPGSLNYHVLYEIGGDLPAFDPAVAVERNAEISPGARILILRNTVSRPARDGSAARIWAMLLSPLTVPVDIALVPLFPVYFVILVAAGGGC